MEIPHSLHSRFLLSLPQALSLFFHCPHITPPNYEAQTTFNPANEPHWPQPSAPSLPLVPLFSCSASPVEDEHYNSQVSLVILLWHPCFSH